MDLTNKYAIKLNVIWGRFIPLNLWAHLSLLLQEETEVKRLQSAHSLLIIVLLTSNYMVTASGSYWNLLPLNHLLKRLINLSIKPVPKWLILLDNSQLSQTKSDLSSRTWLILNIAMKLSLVKKMKLVILGQIWRMWLLQYL